MSLFSVKPVISGALISALMVMQIPATVSAASNPDPISAAQAGIKYLAGIQNDNGAITGNEGDTDWSVIAIQAAGQNASSFHNSKGVSAVDFMAADTPAPSATATSIERRILAIAAAGKDTTHFGGVNYNAKLKNLYSSNQIGSLTLLNDDIFGILAIAATKDSSLNIMAQDSLNYLLSHQHTDGGFSYTTASCDLYCGSDSNDTAAAIVALGSAKQLALTNANLTTSQDKALAYLLSTQKTNGGFGYDTSSPSDGSSTAWSLMALNSIGTSTQIPALAARGWLLGNQNADGGFNFAAYGTTSSDASTTAPAILALLGTTWLLSPAPLQTTPVQSTVAPLASTYSGQPPVPVQSATTPVVLPPAPATSEIEVSPVAPAGSVQGISQTKPAQIQSSQTTPKSNIALYGLLVLLAIAVIWYMLQLITRKKV